MPQHTNKSIKAITLSIIAASCLRADSLVTGTNPSGERVSNTISITGIEDIAGNLLGPFTESIFTDGVPPSVVSGSIPNGSVLPPGPLTDVITFSEPMNTSSTTSSSFDLRGILHGVNYSAASFSWDPTGTVFTINYASLPVDKYTETLFANGFENLVGLHLTSNYTQDFCMTNTGGCPSSVVPEPSSAGLLGLTLLAIGSACWCKATVSGDQFLRLMRSLTGR